MTTDEQRLILASEAAYLLETNIQAEFHFMLPLKTWLRSLQPETTYVEAYRQCTRGDWMLWLVGRLSGEPWGAGRRKLVLCTCECARLALPYVRASVDRQLGYLETLERWARGEATRDEVYSARDASIAASDAAAIVESYAAYASSAAEINARAAAGSVASVAKNISSAASVAADGLSAAESDALLSQCANIVRRHYPEPPSLEVQL